MIKRAYALVLLLVALLVAPALAATTPELQGDRRITIPTGAQLGEVITALKESGASVIVADDSPVSHEWKVDSPEISLQEALRLVSNKYDRAVLLRGRTIVLQRRFSDPAEGAGVEVEEAVLAAKDLLGLVRSLVPPLNSLQSDAEAGRFEKTLTVDQQKRMVREGIPFGELPQAQQDAWLSILRNDLFESVEPEVNKWALLMSKWGSTSLSCLVFPETQQVFLETPLTYPPGEEPRGNLGMQYHPGFDPPKGKGSYIQLLNADERHIPEDLRGLCSVTTGCVTLDAFARSFRREGGPRVEIPAYAAGRKLWVVAERAKRADVVRAVCDLYGWDYWSVKDGYRMGRPVLKAPQTNEELLGRLATSLPPPIRWMGERASENDSPQTQAQLSELRQELAKADPEHPLGPVPVMRLSSGGQVRLANMSGVFSAGLNIAMMMGLVNAAPNVWLHPEEGRLRLSGPLVPGKHPLLSIQVPNGAGGLASHGYVVGSNGPAN